MTITDQLDALAQQAGAVDGSTAVAERLVALAHTTRDRDVWGGDRAITYWEHLPDKVRAATYAGPTIAAWWERMCRQLGCTQPARAEDRLLLAQCISCGDDRAVLDVLASQPQALCLRVRISVQIAREAVSA